MAYKNTSFIIYEETIKEISSNTSTRLATTESTLIMHEFEHFLDFLNNGSPMQTNHQSTAKVKHYEVSDCLMFYKVETMQGMKGLLFGGGMGPSISQ
jgi:hypothetical protein